MQKNETPNTLYYGPGEHKLAQPIELLSNQTLYIDQGAIVYGTIKANNQSNITITGGGILSAEGTQNPNSPLIDLNNDTKNVTISNITLLGSANSEIIKCAPYTTLKNCNIIGYGLNASGITTSNNTNVSNCYLQTGNDALRLYGSNSNISNCAIYQMENGAPFVIANGPTANQKHVNVANCQVIKCTQAWDNPEIAIFVALNNSHFNVEDYSFSNISINDAPWRLVSLQTLPNKDENAPKGTINNIVFNNLNYETGNNLMPKRLSIINSAPSSGNIENISFKNLAINGYWINSKQTNLFEIAHKALGNVTFDAPINEKSASTLNTETTASEWTNPITDGLNSYGNKDFSIFYDNNIYYLTATEQVNPINQKRGVVLYTSNNLKNWREQAILINRANLPNETWYRDEWNAPQIQKIESKYYLTFSCRNNIYRPYKKCGIGLAVADKPEGPYTVITQNAPIVEGNHPTLLSANGKVYLYYDMDGIIYAMPISLNDGKPLAKPQEIYSKATTPNTYRFSDAPFVMPIDNKYLMLLTQFRAGYVINVRQMIADSPLGPWHFSDDKYIMKFEESEANQQLNMPYNRGYTFAPPTQVIFKHSLFKGANEQWYMAWHSSEKYAEPYLCISPIKLNGTQIELFMPKEKHQPLIKKP